MIKTILFILYLATIPAANWMIGHFGQCSANEPCVIPVGFGYMAPSGVLMIGAALVLRDLLQEAAGWKTSLTAMSLGIVVSFILASPFIAVASAVSFAISEMSDFVIYSRIRAYSIPLAVFISSTVGSVIDSASFLYLAFGSLNFIIGQVIGKLALSIPAAIIISIYRNAAFGFAIVKKEGN